MSVIRAACYCRITSDPHDKREGVQRQRADTSALCEIKGWKVAGYYIDNDRSASNGKDRPEWDRLLADVQAGKIDAIAAWDQDGGWRMMHELEALRRFFAGLGRTVLLATTGQGDIDLYSPTGVLAAQIKTAVSEHEIAMMKVRMRRAARAKAESGRPQWRRAFGYMDTPDGPVPDPETAPMVKQCYQHILAGGSISDGARLLKDAGRLGLNGKPWTASTLSLFLRKPRNAGLRAHNGEIVATGTWQGLVDENTWRSVQHILNAPGCAPGKKSVRRHALTGVIHCGKPGCDGYLTGLWHMWPTGGAPGRPKAGETKPEHSGQKAHGITYSCKRCRGCSIRAGHIEEFLYNLVVGRLTKPDAVDLLKSEVHDVAEAERMRAEQMALLDRLDEIADERADGLLTGQQAARATERIQAKLNDIERPSAGRDPAARVRRAAAWHAGSRRRCAHPDPRPFPRGDRCAGRDHRTARGQGR